MLPPLHDIIIILISSYILIVISMLYLNQPKSHENLFKEPSSLRSCPHRTGSQLRVCVDTGKQCVSLGVCVCTFCYLGNLVGLQLLSHHGSKHVLPPATRRHQLWQALDWSVIGPALTPAPPSSGGPPPVRSRARTRLTKESCDLSIRESRFLTLPAV